MLCTVLGVTLWIQCLLQLTLTSDVDMLPTKRWPFKLQMTLPDWWVVQSCQTSLNAILAVLTPHLLTQIALNLTLNHSCIMHINLVINVTQWKQVHNPKLWERLLSSFVQWIKLQLFESCTSRFRTMQLCTCNLVKDMTYDWVMTMQILIHRTEIHYMQILIYTVKSLRVTEFPAHHLLWINACFS